MVVARDYREVVVVVRHAGSSRGCGGLAEAGVGGCLHGLWRGSGLTMALVRPLVSWIDAWTYG